ncbi:TetR/AcrR family transcriptional regulator [Butyrivibrio sp.]|uniref:TetR/AcrR family transcriptional regulator n=1 Tax=Butyrivibrio sp. TaxID=28121 RepID=UPI0025BDFBD2|nr:TetR/AcrR family transcriptional regulator [Butyrivibrio sp.]MBQ9305795.1 TetR/AcrR family transcriptional regulator [Butyrivibrio sp.]
MGTKEAIKTQFMKEYMNKDFSQITVKGLCGSTPVARTTFYSYFENTSDVLEAVEDDLVKGLAEVPVKVCGGNLKELDFQVFLEELEKYIKENWTYIYAFLVTQPDLKFMRKWKDAIKINFSKKYPDISGKGRFEVVAEIAASSVLSAYTYWMEHPDEMGLREFEPLITKLLDDLVHSI